jgi:glycosyltransferase involved in cell wall biosynthesis
MRNIADFADFATQVRQSGVTIASITGNNNRDRSRRLEVSAFNTVLLVHHGRDGLRGTETCLIETARAFAARGWQVVVCRNHSAMDAQLLAIDPPVQVRDMEFPELKIDGAQTAFPLAAYWRERRRLRRLVSEVRPALIYCSGGLPCQLAVPVARVSGIPVVCHFHHPAIKRDYYSWLVKFADHVIFPSQFTSSHSWRNARLAGEVIYNGVDTARFQPAPAHDHSWRQRLGVPPDAIVVGQVAALIPHKRPDLLIRAFARVVPQTTRPLHLCLVGKGELLEPLQTLVRELNVHSRVTITGGVPDVLPFYQYVFDINTLVSRMEGLGLAVVEGSACGLPAVVTDCSGLSETVLPEATGFRFGLDDAAGLESRLLQLINDAQLRARMGAAGREHAVRTFSVDVYGEKIVAAALEVIR